MKIFILCAEVDEILSSFNEFWWIILTQISQKISSDVDENIHQRFTAEPLNRAQRVCCDDNGDGITC